MLDFQAPGLFLAPPKVAIGSAGSCPGHVVGQAAALDAQFGQGLHPVQALHLIAREFGLQTLGWRNFTYRQVLQALGEPRNSSPPCQLSSGLGQFGLACGVSSRGAAADDRRQGRGNTARRAWPAAASIGRGRAMRCRLRQADQQAIFVGALGQRFRAPAARALRRMAWSRIGSRLRRWPSTSMPSSRSNQFCCGSSLTSAYQSSTSARLLESAHVDLPAFGAQLHCFCWTKSSQSRSRSSSNGSPASASSASALAQGYLQAETFKRLLKPSAPPSRIRRRLFIQAATRCSPARPCVRHSRRPAPRGVGLLLHASLRASKCARTWLPRLRGWQ